MKMPLKIAILLVVAGLVAGAIVLKEGKPSVSSPLTVTPVPVKLPKLLDFGATKCMPCKKMVPILEELKATYAGKLEVEFIDVWQNPDAGKQYEIQLIPTQIFYDAAGKELFRHEGFYGREDILGKWKELGLNL